MAVIDEIIQELDLFVDKYKRDKNKLDLYEKSAKERFLFMGDDNSPLNLIDLSKRNISTNTNEIVCTTLEPELMVEPMGEIDGIEYVVSKNNTMVPLQAGGVSLITNLNQYRHKVTITKYDYDKGGNISFRFGSTQKQDVGSINLPKLTFPTTSEILKFTQIIPYGDIIDLKQSVKYNGGAGSAPASQSITVMVGNKSYINAAAVKKDFPAMYNAFGNSSYTKAIIEFSPNTDSSQVFPCTVHWDLGDRYKNFRITSPTDSSKLNCCFMTCVSDMLYIISILNGFGSYSFNIKGDNISKLIELIKNNPEIPCQITLFKQTTIPLSILVERMKDI